MKKKERIDKILSNMGYGSRREIKEFIKKSLVEVNDSVVYKHGYKVDPFTDIICFNGEKVIYREYIYIMMNKPKGLVSSTNDPLHRTVIDLLDNKYSIFNPFPAGRLDKDTEGLLLITNDGQLSHDLLSPKKNVFKKYHVIVDGYVEKAHKEIFKKGLVLDDGYITLPAELEIEISDTISSVNLEIQEGKYHQVKRMFASISLKVINLKRIKIGPLVLDEALKPGEYRELTVKELNLLKSI